MQWWFVLFLNFKYNLHSVENMNFFFWENPVKPLLLPVFPPVDNWFPRSALHSMINSRSLRRRQTAILMVIISCQRILYPGGFTLEFIDCDAVPSKFFWYVGYRLLCFVFLCFVQFIPQGRKSAELVSIFHVSRHSRHVCCDAFGNVQTTLNARGTRVSRAEWFGCANHLKKIGSYSLNGGDCVDIVRTS